MLMYGAGTGIGMRLGQYLGEKIRPFLSKKVRILVGIVFVGILLFLIGVAVHIVSQQNHYKRLQNIAHRIFQAEQEYYNQHGQYTANIEKLGGLLPDIVQMASHTNAHGYDEKEKTENPEIYSAQTTTGDNILVQVQQESGGPRNLQLSAVLEISVFAAENSLPASYAIRHIEGEASSENPTLFQCNVLVLNADTEDQIKRDIRKGERFCKRLGAQPSNIPLVWWFESR